MSLKYDHKYIKWKGRSKRIEANDFGNKDVNETAEDISVEKIIVDF